MDIKIHAGEVALGYADEAFMRAQIDLALTARRPEVKTARAWLNPVPGFAAGSMLRCLVEVMLDDGRCVIGDSCEPDLYLAIERAAGRAGWNLAGSAALRPRGPSYRADSANCAAPAVRDRTAA